MPCFETSGFFFTEKWPVFYEDNHLLALYKPSGLLVQTDQTGDPSLLDLARFWIKRRYRKPGRVFLGLVHRLDRPAAGVILFARTSKAAGRLSEQFRTGKTRKKYAAVVEGRLRQEAGRLVHQVERLGSGSSRICSFSSDKSREARLEFEVLDSSREKTLVEIELETGRHHQIRVQFAHIGHPVLGDLRYGASAPLQERQIALCATELAVIHPTLKNRITFVCPYPAGWPWPGLGECENAPPWSWQELKKEADWF